MKVLPACFTHETTQEKRMDAIEGASNIYLYNIGSRISGNTLPPLWRQKDADK